VATPGFCQNICNIFCDGRDAGQARNPRSAVSTTLFGREIRLMISDEDNMAYGTISNGDPGDQLWLDRSFNGGVSWSTGSRLGDTTIPGNSRQAATSMFNVDGSYNQQQIGALRACAKPGNRDEIACTAWARSTVHAGSPIEAAANSLMQYYNSEGLWTTTNWWNAANCLTAIIDYMRLTGDHTYIYAIDSTFEKNKNKEMGNFCNEYVDDTGWWGLAWVDAYDITGDQKYLRMAQIDADFMYATKDNVCGGGLYWRIVKDSKNAIQNELFIKLAAALHNRIPGDTKYLDQAKEVWQWFSNLGVINPQNLINDGINTRTDCRNNGDVTWTYNQGVILGGLVELTKATGDNSYVNRARQIADAVVSSSYLSPNGILREPCEGGDCGEDGPSFKGVFVRNLGELNRFLNDRPYSPYLENNSRVVYQYRNSLNQYGLHYAGPFDSPGAAKQHSAFETFTAAIR